MFKLYLTIVILLFSINFASKVEAQPVPNFDNTAKSENTGQTIAFTGKKLGLQQLEYEEHCPEDYICMDARFNARYEIHELLAGEYEGKTIDFAVYDHYGTPKFSKQEHAVIYLFQAGNGYFHHKYSYDTLNPVKGEGFAFCGDPYADYEPKEIDEHGREDLEAFDFSPSIQFKLSDYLSKDEDREHMDQDEIREEFLNVMRKFSPPAFKVRGNKATCKMGMTAQNLVDVRMEYEYMLERQQDELHTKCWKQAGLPSEGVSAKTMEESGYKKCMEAENSPR